MIHIVLYRPEKPSNTGNIMRTCVAADVTLDIIGPITFSLDDKDLKRAGLDYIESLKMNVFSSYEEFCKRYPNQEIYYVTRYSNKVYTSFDLSNKVDDLFIMFGRESTGIPHEILGEHPDHLLRIPMVINARSLNLSNCVAIVLYEALRQQDFLSLATHETLKGEDFLAIDLRRHQLWKKVC